MSLANTTSGSGQRLLLSVLLGLIFGHTGTMEQNLLQQWPHPGQTRPTSSHGINEYRDYAPM